MFYCVRSLSDMGRIFARLRVTLPKRRRQSTWISRGFEEECRVPNLETVGSMRRKAIRNDIHT